MLVLHRHVDVNALRLVLRAALSRVGPAHPHSVSSFVALGTDGLIIELLMILLHIQVVLKVLLVVIVVPHRHSHRLSAMRLSLIILGEKG